MLPVSSHTTPPDLDALALSQIAVLKELAELGMRMARLVTVQAETAAQAGAEPSVIKDLSLSLDRAARMVRRTVALQVTLAFDRDALIRQATAASDRAAKAAQDQAERLAHGLAMDREFASNTWQAAEAVERLVDRNHSDCENAEALFDDLHDWTERADLEDTRPIPEIIVEICRELDITPNWGLWTKEDWMGDGAPAQVHAQGPP